MPCFQGLAVSVHALNAPIEEYSLQRQRNARRISAYIPVPPAKVPEGSTTGIPEQSTFAISITLLTPGLHLPYSNTKATRGNPHPAPAVVGPLEPSMSARGFIEPYRPQTQNPNETIAAYIYFDGRPKEEVATLLRKGEETWVNSRWVSVPESEGGGLAEREFLFKEVGLERWLNGLDLEGKGDKAERIQKRQRKLEKKRKKQRSASDSSDEELGNNGLPRTRKNAVLRYDGTATDDAIDDSLLSDNSDSDDEEPPEEEAAGQIKVALFRVLASGDIKKGEYSPQFDAHDDDTMGQDGENGNGEDIDHTTSFAQPKSLDPKSISTQTVTGIDPPDQPYAVFTFFYRSVKQLRKMGILKAPDDQKNKLTSKSKGGPDFSKLGPLNAAGTKGYSKYREAGEAKRKVKNGKEDEMDSDADDEDEHRLPSAKEDAEDKADDGKLLSPEDAKRQGELSEGVQKIKLKRQHSADPLNDSSVSRKSPHIKSVDTPSVGTPQSVNSTSANAGTPPDGVQQAEGLDAITSPFKRQRASIAEGENEHYDNFGILNAVVDGQRPAPRGVGDGHEAGGERKASDANTDQCTAPTVPAMAGGDDRQPQKASGQDADDEYDEEL